MNYYGLSSLLLIVVLAAPGCDSASTAGPSGARASRPRTARDRALAEIHRLRGRVILDSSDGHVMMVNLRATLVTDDDLQYVAKFKHLRALSLNGTQLTDAGLAHLRGLTELESLDLGMTRITDAGLKHLRRLTNLRTLNLLDTGVTDAGLRYLEPLSSLGQVNLERTSTTPRGLRALQEALPNVRIIRDLTPGPT
jgi:Leucine-rich repeat (LRR) protein